MSDVYQPLTRRKQVLVVVLALAVATTVWLGMIYRPGAQPLPTREPPPDAARCVAGQTAGCVGGMATVIVPSTAPAASAGTAVPR